MRLTIQEHLGDGADSDVYAAVDDLERRLAVKIIRPEKLRDDLALQHARILVKAAHKNVVQVIAIERVTDPVDQSREVDAIVMERLQGATLSDYLEHGPLSLDSARTIGLGLLDALLHLVDQGIAHGDLHSEDVMVVDGAAKIIDLLYISGASGLTSRSLKHRIRSDILNARLMLQDVLLKVDEKPNLSKAFLLTLDVTADLSMIREAFERVTAPTMDATTPDTPAAIVDETPASGLPTWISSDQLFSSRLADAFPGARGLTVITDQTTALDRLDIMFRDPIFQCFRNDDGTTRTTYPLWWFRGPINMYISSYERAEGKCILAEHELQITKVAAMRWPGNSMWEFLYLEASAEPPSGAYAYPDDYIARTRAERVIGNFVSEEYAVWRDRAITYEEFDDGAAIVDGRPVQISGAKPRRRYLTNFNVILCGNQNVINSTPQLDYEIVALLDGILDGKQSIDDLSSFITALPRPPRWLRDNDW